MRQSCLLEQEDDGDPATRLAHLISEISEITYAATWLNGIEFFAYSWLSLDASELPLRFGKDEIDAEDVAQLRKYSRLAGGWVAWSDVDVDVGVRFVPLAEWEGMFQARWGRK